MFDTKANNIAKDLWSFVEQRTDTTCPTPPAVPFAKAEEVAKERTATAHKALMDRLGGDHDAWTLIDQYSSALGSEYANNRYLTYLRGMEDGARLADFLKGNVVSQMLAAYPFIAEGDPKYGKEGN